MADEPGAKEEHGVDFPIYRIKKLIQTYAPQGPPDVEAAMLLAKATEMFLDHMVELSMTPNLETSAKRVSLTYDMVAATVATWGACDFLKEHVPQRVNGSLAKQMMAQALAQQSQAAAAPGPDADVAGPSS